MLSVYGTGPLVGLGVGYGVGRMTGSRFRRVQEIFARLAGIAQESVAGIRVVKAFVKEGRFGAIFARSNDDYRDASMSLVRVFGFFLAPMVALWVRANRSAHSACGIVLFCISLAKEASALFEPS